MEIRYIVPEDNRLEISRIYEDSWKYAYKDIAPQAYLDSLPKGAWASRLDTPGRQTLVCLENSSYVGTSSFGGSRFDEYLNWGEVISLYLRPEYIGKGYGKRLLEAVLLELKNQGFAQIFLWVLEENTRAKGFYEHCGFKITEDFLETTIGGKMLREVRFACGFR